MVEFQTNTRCIPIDFSSDGLRLKGILHLPTKETAPPVIIGSHGLLSNGSSPKQIALAVGCVACGIAFFRFDHRGCGDSQGRFQDVTSLEGRCRDLLAAIETVRARADIGQALGLFGSSMGGAVCLATAGASGARAVVTVASPIRSRAIAALEGAPGDGSPKPENGDIPPLSFDIADRLAVLSHVLVVHGDADTVVPVENATEIYQRVGDPKKLLVQAGGDHRMSTPCHQRTFADEAVDWFRRHLFPGTCNDIRTPSF